MERWAKHLVCSKTSVQASLDEVTFLSPAGKPWLVEYDLDVDRGAQLLAELPKRAWSLWRYAELLPLAYPDDRVDLGEGATPLIPLRKAPPGGFELLLKQEAGNPTGSFKDRGLSVAVNRARELGAGGVQLASAGNAAISLAAYAAAAGLPARVAMPVDTPDIVADRCASYGAEVIRSGRTLVESGVHLAQLEEPTGSQTEFWTLSTLKEPYRLEGKKTMGLEVAEQLGWQLPDWLVYPTGGGTGIVGMARAFDQLEALGLIDSRRPRFVAVQMAGCAPIVRAFAQGRVEAEAWSEPNTNVWGLRVPQAIGDFLILEILRKTGGDSIQIEESRIPEIAARYRAAEGVEVGPEGAAVLAAIEDLRAARAIGDGERVVAFQTGHPANYGDWSPAS